MLDGCSPGFEYKILKKNEPNSEYLVVLSGLAFKNLIKNIDNEKLKRCLVAFPGWEKIIELESLMEKFKSLNIKKNRIVEKQISLDNF